MRRLVLGLSQERLGELLGLTFQQIQKYERGANRLGASRLFEAARALDVNVGFFFEDLQDPVAGLAETTPGYLPDVAAPACDRDGVELLRAFEQIGDQELRDRLVELTRALAALDGTPDRST